MNKDEKDLELESQDLTEENLDGVAGGAPRSGRNSRSSTSGSVAAQ